MDNTSALLLAAALFFIGATLMTTVFFCTMLKNRYNQERKLTNKP